jgi:hypothetical protein
MQTPSPRATPACSHVDRELLIGPSLASAPPTSPASPPAFTLVWRRSTPLADPAASQIELVDSGTVPGTTLRYAVLRVGSEVGPITSSGQPAGSGSFAAIPFSGWAMFVAAAPATSLTVTVSFWSGSTQAVALREAGPACPG